jgi:hypothetical protein
MDILESTTKIVVALIEAKYITDDDVNEIFKQIHTTIQKTIGQEPVIIKDNIPPNIK